MKRVLCLTMVLTGALNAHAITIDGSLDPMGYGSPLAVQDTGTGFGDNLSELNAAYAALDMSGNLALMLTGNLEPGGNGLVLFIDSRAGGAIAETLEDGFGQFGSVGGARTDDWGTDIDGDIGVNEPIGGPSVLDPGFNPDISIEINAGDTNSPSTYFTNIIDLTLPNEPNDNRDIFLGSNEFGSPAVVQTYLRADADVAKGHNGTYEHAFDNSNTLGVTDVDATSALTATTGYEALLSSALLANDGQPIRIMAFITNSSGDFLSNQFLGESGLAGSGNLAGPGDPGGEPLFDARVFAGNQYFTVPAPGAGLTGDYNDDGKVDAADYVVWRRDDGSSQGYVDWRSNFGAMAPGSGGFATSAVPEPSSLLLVIPALIAAAGIRKKQPAQAIDKA